MPHYQHNRTVPDDVSSRADAAVSQHYTSGHLAERIFAGLSANGSDLGRLKPEDLAPLDQFHVGGRSATRDLAKLAGIQPGWQVLDIGGGLGGAARLLAREMRCQVTVLDLTPEFVQVGATLSERMDLAGLVHFRLGDAIDLPFDAARFDAVWTQHSTMNIADKGRMCQEIHRVLRTGGRLAMHEIVAGPVQPVLFPTPWSTDVATSFLLPQSELRALIMSNGFRELAWQDTTAVSLGWFKGVAPVPGGSRAALGLHLILGEGFGRALQLQIANLQERRVEIVQAAFVRA